MSSRDLPLWARGATAALLIIGGWYSSRSTLLAGLLGESVVEISAGVIAFSILLGMRLPVDLWPRATNRRRFSIAIAVLTSLVLGSLIVLARSTQIPRLFWNSDRTALGVAVLGGSALAVGWGRTRQAPYARWYAVAALCAVMPVALGMLGLAIRGDVPRFDVAVFGKSVGFLAFFGAAGALVTQEVAFRRLLIGQSGDGGLLAVLIAAVVFGAWHAVIPVDGAVIPMVLLSTLNGIVLGSLYILSRSLLITAVFHGLQNGMLKGYYAAVAATSGEALPSGSLWMPMVLTTVLTAGILAFGVNRRAGFRGTVFVPSAGEDLPVTGESGSTEITGPDIAANHVSTNDADD